MAAIRSKDTRPELIVRRYLFACGFRYRLNSPRLPGHPDLVLRKYRTCIFVNGCFWHGHDCPTFHLPKTNTAFWQAKIERNRRRDREEQQALARMGWHCITVWECQLKPKVREQTLESLAYTLNKIYLEDHAVKYKLPEEGEWDMAAEKTIEGEKVRKCEGAKTQLRIYTMISPSHFLTFSPSFKDYHRYSRAAALPLLVSDSRDVGPRIQGL
mgnify:CR=1 FL=1